jgi:hypothetical protein
MLRNKDLCPGPSACPDVLQENPEPGPLAYPCDLCPLLALREYLASPAGHLISVVIDLDYAIQTGIPVGLDQITYPEFLALRQLTEERNRFESEEIKKSRG